MPGNYGVSLKGNKVLKRALAVTLGAVLVACAFGTTTAGAAGPPVPTAANGNKVAVIGSGIPVPTQFAWAKGNMFIAGAVEDKGKGGIFVINKGAKKVVRIPGTPKAVYGIAYSRGKFYTSIGTSLVVYGQWNGKRFLKKRTILKANKKNFTSFNGVSIAPNGRLYTGVSFEFDSAGSKRKYASSVISVKKSGKNVKLISKGIRQPWQMTFLDGEKQPIVTGLGADTPKGTDAADIIVKANPGTDFGFPTCTWGPSSPCSGFNKPLAIFPSVEPSSSPTGITHRGKKLFVALFKPDAPKVITMDKKGGKIKDFLTGGPAPMVGVGVYKGHLYAGDLTTRIYKVKL